LEPAHQGSIKESKFEQGSLMLMALMVFSIITIVITTILAIAIRENYIALNYGNREQAIQAADAGIQVGRNIILNNLAMGQAPPAEQEIIINENATASITISQSNDEFFTICSLGVVKNKRGSIIASIQIEAEILVPEKGRFVSYRYLD